MTGPNDYGLEDGAYNALESAETFVEGPDNDPVIFAEQVMQDHAVQVGDVVNVIARDLVRTGKVSTLSTGVVLVVERSYDDGPETTRIPWHQIIGIDVKLDRPEHPAR